MLVPVLLASVVVYGLVGTFGEIGVVVVFGVVVVAIDVVVIVVVFIVDVNSDICVRYIFIKQKNIERRIYMD